MAESVLAPKVNSILFKGKSKSVLVLALVKLNEVEGAELVLFPKLKETAPLADLGFSSFKYVELSLPKLNPDVAFSPDEGGGKKDDMDSIGEVSLEGKIPKEGLLAVKPEKLAKGDGPVEAVIPGPGFLFFTFKILLCDNSLSDALSKPSSGSTCTSSSLLGLSWSIYMALKIWMYHYI